MTLTGISLIMSLACTQTCPLSCLQMKLRLRLAWLPPTVGGGPTCLSFQLLLTLPWCPWETQLNLGSHTTLRQHSFPSAYHGNICASQGLATQSIHRPIWQHLTLPKDIYPVPPSPRPYAASSYSHGKFCTCVLLPHHSLLRTSVGKG